MRFRGRIASVFFIALVVALVPVSRTPAEEATARLTRDRFDVIPPAERVQGARGAITVYQTACRAGPTKDSRRRIVDIAVQEWLVFGAQTIDATRVEDRLFPRGLVPDFLNPKLGSPRIARVFPRLGTLEYDPRLDTTIAGYWSATPEGARILAEQNRAWNGPGGSAIGWVEPWSAAFISWVMCEDGLGDEAQFRRSVAHRVYIDQAIAAHDGEAPEAAYAAYDIGEQPIEPGDLICRARGATHYRDLADRRADVGGPGATHCDVVVKIEERGGRVFVIGGNVLQSVSLTILPLIRERGRPPRTASETDIAGAQTYFAHLKLRADAIEPNAMDNSPAIRAPGRSRR
jgi:hypothetical protein